MKFSLTLLSNVLLATSVLAAPASRRAGVSRRSRPFSGGLATSPADYAPFTSTTDSNWAGAAFAAPPAGETFTAVSATFNVPTAKAVNGKAGAGAAWVGIDGYNTDSILQTGIQWEVTAAGKVTFSAWHEWYPADSINFSGLTMAAGDQIKASVVASTSTSGTATIENLTSGQTVTKAISGEALAGQNAEWIVEDFEEGGGLVSFANFGTVTFTDCVAKTGSATLGLSGVDTVDIKQSGKILTGTDVESGSTVAVSYE